MNQKTKELLGLNKLDVGRQSEIEKLFDECVVNHNRGDLYELVKNKKSLIEALGVDRLPSDIEKDLTEKLQVVIECEGKNTLNEKIDKNWFKWFNYAETSKPVDKISKDMFRWDKEGSGGHLRESSPYSSTDNHTIWNVTKKVFIDKFNKKILYSQSPEAEVGQFINDIQVQELTQQGYTIIPIDTTQPRWRIQMNKRITL